MSDEVDTNQRCVILAEAIKVIRKHQGRVCLRISQRAPAAISTSMHERVELDGYVSLSKSAVIAALDCLYVSYHFESRSLRPEQALVMLHWQGGDNGALWVN